MVECPDFMEETNRQEIGDEYRERRRETSIRESRNQVRCTRSDCTAYAYAKASGWVGRVRIGW